MKRYNGQFTIELSDANGDFDNGDTLGNMFVADLRTEFFDLPQDLPFGKNYKLKAIALERL